MFKKLLAITGIITGLMVLSVLLVSNVNAENIKYSVMEEYQRKSADVNKPEGHIATCVHAALANAIAFGMNGGSKMMTGLYDEFVKRMGDKPVNILDAWDVFRNMLQEWAKQGGKELSNDTFNHYQYINAYDPDMTRYMRQIHGILMAGNSIILSLKYPGRDTGHVVNVWSVAYDEEKGHAAVVYTDSDDGKVKNVVAAMYMSKTGKLIFDPYTNENDASAIVDTIWAIRIIN